MDALQCIIVGVLPAPIKCLVRVAFGIFGFFLAFEKMNDNADHVFVNNIQNSAFQAFINSHTAFAIVMRSCEFLGAKFVLNMGQYCIHIFYSRANPTIYWSISSEILLGIISCQQAEERTILDCIVCECHFIPIQ